MLYCPRYVAIRRDLMRELAREQKEDLGLQSFLTGLSEASMAMEDREEAEKTMALMMGEDWIMQTMELRSRSCGAGTRSYVKGKGLVRIGRYP